MGAIVRVPADHGVVEEDLWRGVVPEGGEDGEEALSVAHAARLGGTAEEEGGEGGQSQQGGGDEQAVDLVEMAEAAAAVKEVADLKVER